MATNEEKLRVFPAYVVVDTSSSMAGDRIDAANDIVPRLIKSIESNTALADKLYLSLITFSDDARTVIPLTKGAQLAQVPKLAAGGRTNYSEAYNLLRSEIEAGVITLKTSGYDVLRPAVFFITDGEPTDDDDLRDEAFGDLTDSQFPAHPNIVMFGVGEAQEPTLRRYTSHHGSAVIARDGANAAEALEAMIEVLILSVVASTARGEQGQGSFSIDEEMLDNELLAVLD